MSVNRLGVVGLFLICVFFGCGDASHDPTNSPETQLTFVDHGAVVLDPVSTTVTVTADSIEYSTSQAGTILERWSSQLQPSDYDSVLEIMDAYDFLQINDITLADGQESCAGWAGMTITIDEEDSSNSFDIMGNVCSSAYWPEGVQALVGLKDELVTKYRDIEQAHGIHIPVPTSEISYIQIVQDNGNVAPGDERYVEYAYERTDMTPEALHLLGEITLATENLSCINDGTTYEVNLTDDSGSIHTYVSDNKACGRENETDFISVEDIEALIDALVNG